MLPGITNALGAGQLEEIKTSQGIAINGLTFVKIPLLLLFLFIPSSASHAGCLQGINGQVYCGAGACKKDSAGKVYCSIYKDGGAELNSLGGVECGVGQCLQGSTGRVFCSVAEDGGAALNSARNVKCYGGCEPGSESMCERTDGL